MMIRAGRELRSDFFFSLGVFSSGTLSGVFVSAVSFFRLPRFFGAASATVSVVGSADAGWASSAVTAAAASEPGAAPATTDGAENVGAVGGSVGAVGTERGYDSTDVASDALAVADRSSIGLAAGLGAYGDGVNLPAGNFGGVDGRGADGRMDSPAEVGDAGLTAERRGAEETNSSGSALAENRRPADAGSAASGSGSTGAGGGTGVLPCTSSGSTGLAGLTASRRSRPVLVSGDGSSGMNARP
jgi:hypothetical protein